MDGKSSYYAMRRDRDRDHSVASSFEIADREAFDSATVVAWFGDYVTDDGDDDVIATRRRGGNSVDVSAYRETDAEALISTFAVYSVPYFENSLSHLVATRYLFPVTPSSSSRWLSPVSSPLGELHLAHLPTIVPCYY